MNKICVIAVSILLAACAVGEVHNPKDIPVDTGARPQSNVTISAPPGTMGHGRF